MVDVTEVSAVVAAAGVLVGVAYYILEIRHQTRMRETDLLVRLSTYTIGRDFMEAVADVHEAEFEDYDDFVRKYGEPFSKKPVSMSFNIVGNFCEQLGVLYRNKLIDISLVEQSFGVCGIWETMRPFIEGMRKKEQDQSIYEWFEYLYNEMKKREQQLSKTQ